jgi:hypothetical protein
MASCTLSVWDHATTPGRREGRRGAFCHGVPARKPSSNLPLGSRKEEKVRMGRKHGHRGVGEEEEFLVEMREMARFTIATKCGSAGRFIDSR